MLDLGLSAEDFDAFTQALRSSHEVKVTVEMLGLDHSSLMTLNNVVIDGQVDVRVSDKEDDDENISRTLLITILDPSRSLALDSGLPTEGSIFYDKMLSVTYSVYVRANKSWVDVPIFTGPVVQMSRNGDLVDIEAHSKEHFALSAAWSSYTIKKGTNKGVAIKDLLTRSGELDSYIDLGEISDKTKENNSLGREDLPWILIRKFVRSLDKVGFYDGRGVFRLISKPEKPVFEVKSGANGMMLGKPSVDYTIDSLVNAAEVTGGTPKQAKKPVVGVYEAPKDHPLSRYSLGRNGATYTRIATESDSDLKSKAKCVARAKEIVEESLLQSVLVKVDCLPIPHLEPWDLIHIKDDEFSLDMRLTEFSFSFGQSLRMTIGENRDVREPRKVS